MVVLLYLVCLAQEGFFTQDRADFLCEVFFPLLCLFCIWRKFSVWWKEIYISIAASLPTSANYNNMALVQFCNCIQMVTGCDLKNLSIHMVYMCISVDAMQNIRYKQVQLVTCASMLCCIHTPVELFSDTVVSFRCEDMLQI